MITLLFIAHAAAADLTFAVVGDPQTDGSHDSINFDVFPPILEGAQAAGASVLLVAGDLVDGAGTPSGTAAQWVDFHDAIAAFDGEVFMVPGNHDMYGGPGTFAAWRASFPWLPTDDSPPGEEGISYYIDRGDVRFVMITSDHEDSAGRVSSDGLAWLDRVLADSGAFAQVFVVTHHPVTFSQDNNLGGTSGDLWQLLVAYGVTGLFTGHWHRYQPSQPGAGGDTWETIIGTGGGWQGFEPIRPYQQVHGFLLVEVTGASAEASFIVDEDGDGAYDDVADTYTMAWPGAVPRGLRARYAFDDGTAADSAPAPLGKALHGELKDGATVADDGGTPALVLDGARAHLEAGALGDYALDVHGDLTLSLWARVDAPPPTNDYGSVLGCYATADYYSEDEETNYAWYLSVRDDGVLVAFWEHGEGANVYLASTAPSPLVDGDWHHVTLVRDEAAGELRFAVDGAAVGDPVPYTDAPTGGGRGMLYLGSDVPAYPGYELAGALDEVCIFDTVLDAKALAALGTRADCAAVLDAEPPDTEDTGDTGEPPDTDEPPDTEDTGDTEPAETDTDDTDAPVGDTGADTAGSGAAKGCGCGPGVGGTGGAAVWALALLAATRRRSA